MIKRLKYCEVCTDKFAERFTCCPICGSRLSIINTPDVSGSITINTDDENDSVSFNVTLFENRNGNTRGALMLGSFLLVISAAVSAVVFSIYNADAYVAGIDDNLINIVLPPQNVPVAPEVQDSEQDTESGGRGSGGNEDRTPVSFGNFASQSSDPKFAPSAKTVRLTDSEIKLRLETTGVIERKAPSDQYGDSTSRFDIPSDGPGSNGGQGNGPQRGQGPGKGPGGGPDDGTGIGPGPGGPGDPNKSKVKEVEPPQPRKGPTVGLKITIKPRAIYTNDARKNLISGTVTLRVTFMANGAIGNIAVIGGLPDGLTEQATIAARSIQFEPARQNGIAQTVTKQIQYTFTLY